MMIDYLADNLELASPVAMPLVLGIDFDRFDGRRYVGNAEKRAIYPEDDAAAEALLNSY